ncbi:MAG: hypothetical protein ACLU20_07660 [Thomasclavelia spiroformis]
MLDLHTHKNQLQAHPNDHKKDLMNLALKLHELQTEMSNNIQYISEHKYICSTIIDKISETQEIPKYLADKYKKDVEAVNEAVTSFYKTINTLSEITTILNVDVTTFDSDTQALLIEINNKFIEKFDTIVTKINEINIKYSDLSKSVEILREQQMKDTEYISQHRNWFSNFFFGSKYTIWIIGAIGGLILFIVNFLRSVDISFK